MRDHDADRAAQGDGGVLAGDRAGEGLRRQLAEEVAVHVLGESGAQGNVALAVGNQVSVGIDDRLVVVHADGHTERDGIGLLRQGHGRAGAHGVEVAGILGGDTDILARRDLSRRRDRLVRGHGDADSRGNLNLGVGLLAHRVDAALCVRGYLPGGFVGALASRVLAVGRDAKAAQGVRGGRGVVVGILALAPLLLVQALVDLLIGIGALLAALAEIVDIRAVQHLIGAGLHAVGLVADLGHGTPDVAAHGGGDGAGDILAVAVGRDFRAAGQRHIREHLRLHGGIGDIQCHARAHRGALAHGEGAGGGLSLAVLGGGDGQIARGQGDFHARCHARAHIGIENVQRDRGVEREVLRRVGVPFALQRVAARGGGDIFLVVGFGRDGQRTGSEAAALADLSDSLRVSVDHRERRADADRLAAAVLGRGLGCFFFGLVLFALLDLHDKGGDFALGHADGVDVLRGAVLLESISGFLCAQIVDIEVGACNDLDIVVFAVGIGIAVAQLGDLVALGFLDDELDHVAFAGGPFAVLGLAAHDMDGHGIVRQGLIGQDIRIGQFVHELLGSQRETHIHIVGQGGQIAGFGVELVPVAVAFDLDGAGLFLAVRAGVAVAGGGGQLEAVLEGDVDNGLILILVSAVDGTGGARAQLQRHMVAADGVIALDHIGVGLGLGGFIRGGVAVGVQSGGGDVLHAAKLLRLNGHVTGDGESLAALGNRRAGIGVEHRDSHAAGDAHIPRARAGDRLRVDHVSDGIAGGLQLQIKMIRQRSDGGIGQRDRSFLRRGQHGLLELRGKIRLGQGGDHFLVIEHLGTEGVGHIIGNAAENVVDISRAVGVLDLLKRIDRGVDILIRDAGNVDGPNRLLKGLHDKVFQLLLHSLAEFVLGLAEDLAHVLLEVTGKQPAEQIAAVILEILDHTGLDAVQHALAAHLQLLHELASEVGNELILQRAQVFRTEITEVIGIAQCLHEGLDQLFRQAHQSVLGIAEQPLGLVILRTQIAAAKQFLQPGGVDQRLGHFFGHIAQNLAQQILRKAVLIQAHLFDELIHIFFYQLAQLLRQIVIGLDLVGGPIIRIGCGLQRCGGDLQFGRVQLAVAKIGGILDRDDIHRRANTHADIGIGGAGVGLDLACGAVHRGDGHQTAGAYVCAI